MVADDRTGREPRSPGVGEPNFDLAWTEAGTATVVVAEVKSLTDANEEKQLRLGLGQVLRYRHLLRGSHPSVTAVLVIEREPVDVSWAELCRDLDVALCWPGCFEEALHLSRTSS